MINKEEFKYMEFNPQGKPGWLFSNFPKLGDLVETRDERLVKYALYMYDCKSPMRSHYPDISSRKDACAALAGYDLEKESDTVSNLKSLTIASITLSDDGDEEESVDPFDELLDTISSILRYQKNRVWTMIATNEQSFYEYQRRIMAEVDGGANKDALSAVTLKTKLLEAMDDIHRRLDKYYSELSGEDLELIAAMTKKTMSTAEQFAKR